MYANTFKLYCDHEHCAAHTEVEVHMTIVPALVRGGLDSRLVFHPYKAELPEGWTQGWDGSKTAVACPKHKVKK